MKGAHFLVAAVAPILALACDDWSGGGGPGGDSDTDSIPGDTTPDVPVDITPDLPPGVVQVDLLLVVDNSIGMDDEQAVLRSTFPAMIGELLNPTSGARAVTDLHAGVVSTDMGAGGYPLPTCTDDPVDGDDGVFRHMPSPAVAGCDASYATFLEYESVGYDEDRADHITTGLGCTASLGDDGCGFEQPIKAAAKALTDHASPGGENAGFLRQDSILAILFLVSEDDCSVEFGSEAIFDPENSSLGYMDLRCYNHPDMVRTVDSFITEFGWLKENPDWLVMGFIVGVPLGPTCEGFGDEISSCLEHPDMVEQPDSSDPTRLEYSCTTADVFAFPPRRFVQMAQALGSRATVGSICSSDYSPSVARLVQRIQQVIGY